MVLLPVGGVSSVGGSVFGGERGVEKRAWAAAVPVLGAAAVAALGQDRRMIAREDAAGEGIGHGVNLLLAAQVAQACVEPRLSAVRRRWVRVLVRAAIQDVRVIGMMLLADGLRVQE